MQNETTNISTVKMTHAAANPKPKVSNGEASSLIKTLTK